MFLPMYAATSRFANRCLRGGRFATIGSPLKFGLRKLHVRFTPKNGLRWSDRPSPKGAMKRHSRESGGGVVSSQVSIVPSITVAIYEGF
jgi:hypothetical protein